MKLLLSLLAIIYFLLPYDILPDLALGWGWIDDLLIFYFLWRFFYRGKGPFFRQPQRGEHSGEQGEQGESPTSSDDGSKDPYEVLQIPRGASKEEIKTAYKHLAGKYHPDKVLHLGEEFQALAERRFKEIQAAYQKLAGKGRKDRP
ncbi:MAG: DnaJ domain-containing protein [Deltaproteobacteria bacterium]|jgi:DnaJ like chaperone protein|nr:DnaJ domain-containing protein [Deltaproteobacteria bacterium]